MSKFDTIRPFSDTEVNEGIKSSMHHPMMKALMNFSFPGTPDEEWKAQLLKTHSIRDFQCNFIYQSLQQVLQKSSEGLSTSGFDKLDKNTSYLYISNHRDIILDTSLLNMCLFDHGLIMTASAIGDNLVQKSFIKTLARLNRNFLVQRGLSPREMLASSKLLAEYIGHLITEENRSVWIAQREGRTKDGNDSTHQGVLKMLGMGNTEGLDIMQYFRKLKIVPVSISYEYDPTDALKMPQIIAEAKKEVYVKNQNEDFENLLSGVMGQKKHIHIHLGDVLDIELDEVAAEESSSNKQIQALAGKIDDAILRNYRLWPTNFIAYDIVNKTEKYSDRYRDEEKGIFERRMMLRINEDNPIELAAFLAMYANPVVNKEKYGDV
ncbi:1-acyl-sn-glycerol-3-phosphate acyltransferase [Flavobacterium ardleyense]|uniref:1-acyl-sn-glycerol-3-phosphate acyltransferase n=1 Tax=Flavobacterium ardleyense TaxID=2038737 RepID=UPI00298C7AA1|nr:1-acyl-sn-glycerol-3-phosphate acyltransferase [Flavobacterium ardleyense]